MKEWVMLTLVILFTVTALFAAYVWTIFDGYTLQIGSNMIRVFEDMSYVVTNHYSYEFVGCLPFGLCQD